MLELLCWILYTPRVRTQNSVVFSSPYAPLHRLSSSIFQYLVHLVILVVTVAYMQIELSSWENGTSNDAYKAFAWRCHDEPRIPSNLRQIAGNVGELKCIFAWVITWSMSDEEVVVRFLQITNVCSRVWAINSEWRIAGRFAITMEVDVFRIILWWICYQAKWCFRLSENA